MAPETPYTTSDGLSIAYQVVGEWPRTLVYVPGRVSNVEPAWEVGDQDVVLVEIEGLLTGARVGAVPDRMLASSDGRAGLGCDVCADVHGGDAVEELAAGSGLVFDDRGSATLEGVPGQWRLFAARA